MPVESGLRPGRLEYVEETTFGEPPTDPAWNKFSDSYQNVTFGAQAVISPRRRVGSADIQAFNAGSEDHTFSITYDVQQWLSSGAANDAISRDANGELTSHTIVERVILGTNSLGGQRRMYTVLEGSKINSMSLSGEPGSGDPIMATLDYLVQKGRVYLIDQPGAAINLEVHSTDAADDGLTLTIEDDDAGTSEDVTLNNATPPTTTATFETIDAAYLDAEPEGDVTIEDGSGTVLLTIYGKSSYDDRAGDRGVPLLGSGSHASDLGGAYENFLGDTVERPSGTELLFGVDISSVEFTVENGLEATDTHKSIGKRINEGPRVFTLNATVYGEKAGYESIVDHLRKLEQDIVWTLTGGTLTMNGAVLTEPGDIVHETESAVMSIGNTFTAATVTLNP